MKKKIFITLGLIAVLLVSAASFVYAKDIMAKKHPSDYKIGISYEEAVKSDKPVVALFYVDWCGYCLRFMPKYRILDMIYKNDYNFVMINAEDKAHRKLVEDAMVSGYPTIYILDPKYDNRVHLNQGLYSDLGKFRIELDRYLRIRTLLDKASASVDNSK